MVFKTVRVGGDGTCLAASYTPTDQAREVTFAVYPAEFHDWAVSADIPQPPTSYCAPPQSQPDSAIARITQPSASATITATQLFIRGTARGPYVLEVGPGRVPLDWQPITQNAGAVADGVLGVWRTDALAPGEYTLRLRVTTPEGVPVEATTTVQIRR